MATTEWRRYFIYLFRLLRTARNWPSGRNFTVFFPANFQSLKGKFSTDQVSSQAVVFRRWSPRTSGQMWSWVHHFRVLNLISAAIITHINPYVVQCQPNVNSWTADYVADMHNVGSSPSALPTSAQNTSRDTDIRIRYPSLPPTPSPTHQFQSQRNIIIAGHLSPENVISKMRGSKEKNVKKRTHTRPNICE
jgi:hypothetical protein